MIDNKTENRNQLLKQLCVDPCNDDLYGIYYDNCMESEVKPISREMKLKSYKDFIPNFQFLEFTEPTFNIEKLDLLRINPVRIFRLSDTWPCYKAMKYKDTSLIIEFYHSTITCVNSYVKLRPSNKMERSKDIAKKIFLWIYLNICRKEIGYPPLKPPYSLIKYHNGVKTW